MKNREGTNEQETLMAAEKLWVEADRLAPRSQCVTRTNPRHPSWNEDRVLCDPLRGVAAIFDGLGGYAGGEAAACAACGTLARFLLIIPAQEDVAGRSGWLRDALEEAQNAISLSRQLHLDAPYQTCTATVLLLSGRKVLVANIGDSRAYRYSRSGGSGNLTDLTGPVKGMAGDEDRESLYVRLDEVSTHVELDNNERLRDLFMQRNIVPGVLAHVPGSFRSAVSVQEHDCETGDVFVICSDGVHDNLTGTEIQATIEEKLSGGATAIVEALTSKAWLRSQEDHVRAKPDDISAACLIG